MELDTASFEKYLTLFTDWVVTTVPKLLIAAIVLWVGFKIIKKINQIIVAMLAKTGIGTEIERFLASIIDIVFKFVVILVAAGIAGFEVSSLMAVLAAAGFAIGLALQGFLGNFASGLTIIFFKPYKIGDWVSLSDSFGRVQDIQIFNTTLITPGDKTLIIPNGQVTDNIITNLSTEGRIRLELAVSMPYAESFPKVKKIVLGALSKLDIIMHEPPPLVGIETFDTHNIILSVRPYIHPDDYWDATFKCYEAIKAAFNDNGIKVAYSEGIELGTIGD